jgi:hypothetical protein
MNLKLRRLEKRFDLQSYIDQFDFKMVGDNAVMDCPQCGREQKLYVLMQEKRDRDGEIVPRGTWICYYCNDTEGGGAGRTCLSLIEFLEDLEFIEAARRLADGGSSSDADFVGAIEKMIAALDEEDSDVEANEPPPTIELPREFIRIREHRYPGYVAERGISLDRAMRFGLGYCTTGYYANRLIAPVHFERRCVGFQARYMKKKPPRCKEKKLPCSECDGTTRHKRLKKTKHAKGAKMSRVIYNWDDARQAKRLILVESPWAVIKIGRSGGGTFGKNLSASQFELILKCEADEVVIMWDRDEDHSPGKGGYDKSVRVAEQLSQFVRVRAVRMPDERDPDEHTLQSLLKLIKGTRVLDANAAWAERVRRRMAWFEV